MKKGIVIVVMAFIVSIVTHSCEQEKVDYRVLAEDTNIVQALFDDLFKVIDEEAKNGEYADTINGKKSIVRTAVADTCAVVTLEISGGFPMTLEIDFGSGCTITNTVTGGNIIRKGMIRAVFSGLYSEPGSTVTITTHNYSVNGYLLEGTKTIVNNGRNASNHLEFLVSVQNGLITKPNGGEITWISERTNEWIEGESTNFFTDGISGICDDVYLIEGYGAGTASDGTDYRIESVEPLKKEICCRWVTGGILAYFINGNELGSIDYEQTTCYNPFAIATIGGQEIIISIL